MALFKSFGKGIKDKGKGNEVDDEQRKASNKDIAIVQRMVTALNSIDFTDHTETIPAEKLELYRYCCRQVASGLEEKVVRYLDVAEIDLEIEKSIGKLQKAISEGDSQTAYWIAKVLSYVDEARKDINESETTEMDSIKDQRMNMLKKYMSCIELSEEAFRKEQEKIEIQTQIDENQKIMEEKKEKINNIKKEKPELFDQLGNATRQDAVLSPELRDLATQITSLYNIRKQIKNLSLQFYEADARVSKNHDAITALQSVLSTVQYNSSETAQAVLDQLPDEIAAKLDEGRQRMTAMQEAMDNLDALYNAYLKSLIPEYVDAMQKWLEMEADDRSQEAAHQRAQEKMVEELQEELQSEKIPN